MFTTGVSEARNTPAPAWDILANVVRGSQLPGEDQISGLSEDRECLRKSKQWAWLIQPGYFDTWRSCSGNSPGYRENLSWTRLLQEEGRGGPGGSIQCDEGVQHPWQRSWVLPGLRIYCWPSSNAGPQFVNYVYCTLYTVYWILLWFYCLTCNWLLCTSVLLLYTFYIVLYYGCILCSVQYL